MKETPILFTPENYASTVEGRKLQTRRLTGLEDINLDPDCWKLAAAQKGRYHFFHDEEDAGATIRCPYGVAGDKLWVKEGLERHFNVLDYVRYRSDKQLVHGKFWEWMKDTLSPIHMPKWACRLWLELTEVRVERLQEITEEDAKAEGCDDGMIAYQATPGLRPASARVVYSRLWKSINGAGSWESNPWVWVLTFQRITP